jgi:hypothetical protein
MKRLKQEASLRTEFPSKLKYLFGTIDHLRDGQKDVTINHAFIRGNANVTFKYPNSLQTFYHSTNQKTFE